MAPRAGGRVLVSAGAAEQAALPRTRLRSGELAWARLLGCGGRGLLGEREGAGVTAVRREPGSRDVGCCWFESSPAAVGLQPVTCKPCRI